MIKIKYHPPGTPPATLQAPAQTKGQQPIITLIQYDGQTLRENDFEDFSKLMAQFDPAMVNWNHHPGGTRKRLFRGGA